MFMETVKAFAEQAVLLPVKVLLIGRI